MPRSQLNEVLDAELGTLWSSKLLSFDYEPVAAASIGQVIDLHFFFGVTVIIRIYCTIGLFFKKFSSIL